MSPVKTVEAIEMPFALKTQVGSGNHLLDIAALFQPNTVLWAFPTIQTSSLRCREFFGGNGALPRGRFEYRARSKL